MRRISALLFAAGLAAAPASAVAGPSPTSGPSSTVEHVEWSAGKGRLGVMVMPLTPELREHFGAQKDRGVLIANVEPGSPAAKAGMDVGDVLVAVRGQPITDASDVLGALADLGPGQKVSVALVRDGKPRTLDVTLANHATTFSSPFDEPWFKTWFTPLERPTPRPRETTASNWLRELRQLFEKSSPSTPDRS